MQPARLWCRSDTVDCSLGGQIVAGCCDRGATRSYVITKTSALACAHRGRPAAPRVTLREGIEHQPLRRPVHRLWWRVNHAQGLNTLVIHPISISTDAA